MRKRVTIAEAKRVTIAKEKAPAAVRHIVDEWFILLDKESVEYRAPPRGMQTIYISLCLCMGTDTHILNILA